MYIFDEHSDYFIKPNPQLRPALSVSVSVVTVIEVHPLSPHARTYIHIRTFTDTFIRITSLSLSLSSPAYQFARKLVSAEALRNWDMTLNNNLLPQCEKYGNFTIPYIECFLRQITLSGNAPVGTCKMGAAGDPTAVVDPTLR